MNSLLRSWRVLWLALAVAMAPQLTLVHALSHVSAATAAAQPSGDDRQQVPDKACDTCVLLAHLGQAITVQHSWAPGTTDMAAPVAVTVTPALLRAPAHFQARAPPFFL